MRLPVRVDPEGCVNVYRYRGLANETQCELHLGCVCKVPQGSEELLTVFDGGLEDSLGHKRYKYDEVRACSGRDKEDACGKGVYDLSQGLL